MRHVLTQNNIPVMPWPAYSSDLNQIPPLPVKIRQKAQQESQLPVELTAAAAGDPTGVESFAETPASTSGRFNASDVRCCGQIRWRSYPLLNCQMDAFDQRAITLARKLR